MNNKNPDFKFIAIGIVILVVGVLFTVMNFTSNSTHTCTFTQEQNGMTMSSKVDFKFKGKNLSAFDMQMVMELGKYKSQKNLYLSMFKSKFKSQMDQINSKGGKAEIELDGDNIVMNISASKKGVTTMFSKQDDNYTYKALKKQLEATGYTCK